MDYSLVVFDSLISATALIAPRPGRVQRYLARFSEDRYVDIVVHETDYSPPVDELLALIPVPGSAVIVAGQDAHELYEPRRHALHAVIALESGDALR